MEFNGLPLHPLVVHVVVIFAPLAGVAGIAYAAMPRWRWLLRWPLVAVAVIAAVAGVIAVQSGQSLADDQARGPLIQLASVEKHRARGHLLRWFLLAFLVPAGLGAWLLGGPSALASGAGTRETRNRVIGIGVQVLLVLAGLAVLYQTFLTGDSGARAVWER